MDGRVYGHDRDWGMGVDMLRICLDRELCTATGKLWLNRARGKERGISLDVDRTPSRTSRGLLRGRQPVRFVICGGNFQVICESSCQH